MKKIFQKFQWTKLNQYQDFIVVFIIKQSLKAWFIILLFLYGFTLLGFQIKDKAFLTNTKGSSGITSESENIDSSNNELKKNNSEQSNDQNTKSKTYYPRNKTKPFTRVYWKV